VGLSGRGRGREGWRTYAVLFLLHVQLSAIIEGPMHDIGLVVGALDELARLEGGPEVAEVLN
jgi:hypothetical protein